MLSIINILRPFFEDCYRRVSVREYSRISGVSPPTASKMLKGLAKEGLLVKEKDRGYLLFSANKGSRDFIDLSKVYWRGRLGEAIAILENTLASPAIVLFGSLSKAEAKQDSDIDLAVFAAKKPGGLESLEKKLKRKIQVFWFRSIGDVKNKELAKGILNGYVLSGRL